MAKAGQGARAPVSMPTGVAQPPLRMLTQFLTSWHAQGRRPEHDESDARLLWAVDQFLLAMTALAKHDEWAVRSIPAVRRRNLKPSPPVSLSGRVAVAYVQGPPKGGGALW
jgi:hypothetical protein